MADSDLHMSDGKEAEVVSWTTRANGPAMTSWYVRRRMVRRVAKLTNQCLKNGWRISLQGWSPHSPETGAQDGHS